MALSVISCNVNGLNEVVKRNRIRGLLKKLKPDICCLQETHLINADHGQIRNWRYSRCFFSSSTDRSRGVAILIVNHEVEVLGHTASKDGWWVSVNIMYKGCRYKIFSLYADNKDNPQALQKIEIECAEWDDFIAILGGFQFCTKHNTR